MSECEIKLAPLYLLHRELFRRHFDFKVIYFSKRKLLEIYLKNLGVLNISY